MGWERARDGRTCPGRLLMHGNQMSEFYVLYGFETAQVFNFDCRYYEPYAHDSGLQYFIKSHKHDKINPASLKMVYSVT